MVRTVAQDIFLPEKPLMNKSQSWWQRIWSETRTRILLLYATAMLLVAGISVPIVLVLFLNDVDRRVKENLTENMETLMEAYELWETSPNQSFGDLKGFVTDTLNQVLAEDDNFLIFYLNQKYYKSTPRALPMILGQGSEMEQYWINLTHAASGHITSGDPEIGSILYLAHPIYLEGERRGMVVAAHTTAGERQEALAGVYIFAWVALGVALLSLVLAWLATAKLLHPVKQLATVAHSINESNLTQRIAVKGTDELCQLANTFNHMMDRIQSAFLTQRNFVNDAGHELRTPITIIQGHLEVMGDDPQEQRETLELVSDELRRMNRIVNDLLLLAKLEQPDFLQLQPLEMKAFTEEIFQKIQPLGDRNWQIHTEGPARILGDRQRLTGAVANLAQNAVQHTRMGDLIELGSCIRQGSVRLWVRDTGEGIAPNEQQRIFDRFARSSHRFRPSEGAGLGLSIVKAIAEAHNGWIELESKVGIGSTFTLVLPLDPLQETLYEPHPDRRR